MRISNIYFNSRPFVKLKLTKSIISCLFLYLLGGCSPPNFSNKLNIHFKGGYGQVEIGGKYVGAEFHHSRPLPSRLSFYYPVANSIVTNADYWHRDESFPLTLLLKSEGKADTIGHIPYPYHYTPFNAQFDNIENNYKVIFSYDVCDNLPVIVLKINLQNTTDQNRVISVETLLEVSLRTSHTFALRNQASLHYDYKSAVATAAFNEIDTDSALVFVANAGHVPVHHNNDSKGLVCDPKLQFTFQKNLDAGEQIEIIQLIGMCRQKESRRIIDKSLQYWQQEISKNKERILNYTFNQTYFSLTDKDLLQTAQWSKALLACNMHYIDGYFMPMPCPAEYNFFFTHDLLLTGLGAMNFDLDYMKRGFGFLNSLTKKDSILAHAYYWKDTGFLAEYCNSDNWNNMWIIIAASSYLKHSADYETVENIFPILKKSLELMLESKGADNLVYSRRPDWWDIGNVTGAKVYNTALMYKALQDYVYIALQLNKNNEPLSDLVQLATRMKKQFAAKFWDEKSEFLMNMMNNDTVDHHYYSGSLVSTFYGLLDDDKISRLLKTAKDTLLDENIGIRNAMPPDFHELISVYKFNGMEAGAPHLYFNGAVWPQGNAWYALGLVADNQVEEAKNVVERYLTLKGIQNSPNGQPSFYECRNSDSKSPHYGEIDKPSFLWAGGWYLYVLYQLAGLRENSFNIYFDPRLPSGFENAEYDLTLFGNLCRIKWRGHGNYFKKIEIDGQIQHSSVITSPATTISLERGKPKTPYLAEANCTIHNVIYQAFDKKLVITFSSIIDQSVKIAAISPNRLERCELNGSDFDISVEINSDNIYRYILKFKTTTKNYELVFYFI
ncbi:hypothetical protein JXA70_01325 [candidate division KSB1 bacterium]|nr:hypothetical protein [candidate division KSB1 bacterium]